MKEITVSDLIKEYGTQVAAAKALDVSRMTLWAWQRAGGAIPDPWCYKARDLLKATQAASQ